MSTWTEYTLASADNPYTLSGEVGRLMKAGWQPTGGVCVKQNVYRETFYQAMVK